MAKNFSLFDYLVFTLLLVASSLIGVFYAYKDRKSKDNQNYLTGSRNLAVFPVCMSLIASFLSSNTMLGVPAEVYLLGTQFYANMIGFTIACLLAAHVFMPIYYKLRLTSVNKYLQRRFDSVAVRIAGSIGFILCTLPYLGVVLFGPSLALSAVTPLEVSKSILVVGAICTFYTSIGGIKAVIWTDVIQCLLMAVGLAMIVYQGLIEVGGWSNALKIAEEGQRLVLFNPEFNIYRGDTFWSIFLSSLVGWGGTYCVKQTQVQRYCCMESAKKARLTLYWNIPGVVFLSMTALVSGIVIFAKYAGCDPISIKLIDREDQLAPFFVMNSLASIPGLPGLFVASVFSGSLSTLSSGMNALATVTWDDLLKRYFRETSEKKILWINKITSLLYGILTILIAFTVGRLGTVLQASLSLSGAVTGPLAALFCLGIFFPFVNGRSALIGVVSGFSLCIWISMGALIYKRPKLQLPVSIDKCPAQIYETLRNSSIFDEFKNKSFSPTFEPKGIFKLYHVSYMSIAPIGFFTALTLGLVIALIYILLGKKPKPVEAHLLSPIVHRLYSNVIPSTIDGDNNQKFDKISLPENFAINTKVTHDMVSKATTVRKAHPELNSTTASDANARRAHPTQPLTAL